MLGDLYNLIVEVVLLKKNIKCLKEFLKKNRYTLLKFYLEKLDLNIYRKRNISEKC